jgi:hypothetical protein
MMDEKTRGIAEMTLAMTISGTIGWFVIMAGRPVLDVVFWRCVFGAVALFAICAGLGLFRRRMTSRSRRRSTTRSLSCCSCSEP